MRTGFFLAVLATAAAASAPAQQPGKLPFPAWRVSADKGTVGSAAAELTRQTGVPIAVPADAAGRTCAGVKEAPFWDALDRLAASADLRVSLRDAGRAVELLPKGASREVVSTAGPFRVVAKQVTGRALLAEGMTVYDVQLDLQWERRYHVFRVDSNPQITHVADDRGVLLQPQTAGAKTQPTGAVHAASVKLGGIAREAKRVGVLKGSFAVTASEKLLDFRFDVAAKKAAPVVKEGVSAALIDWSRDGSVWAAEVELTYPPTLPEFESFEASSFTSANEVRLVAPGPSGKRFAPESQAVGVVGRRVSATYYFKADGVTGPAAVGPGWALAVDAAATPVEFRVPFELRDIVLP
ncbi:MAG TPA: hypothetical protein VD866_15065 [Urbifossiella sp.]|nr:hypothetical protein [Urbifossiella sp.]